jgi:hypothetical protein
VTEAESGAGAGAGAGAGPSPRRRVSAAASRHTVDQLTRPAYLTAPSEPVKATLALRPFGYLLMTLVWSCVLLLVVFALIIALPFWLSDGLGAGGLGAAPGFHRSDSWLAFIAIPVFVVPLLGCITVFAICASLGLALGTATLFVRSLLPSYRHERLSTTIRSTGGEAVGPVSTAFTGVGLSLLPVRLTRWSKLVLILQFNGWIINGNLMTVGLAWGCCYVFSVGWMLWPASGAAVWVCAAFSLLLAGWLVRELWRRRAAYADVMPAQLRGTRYEYSWPNRPAAKKPTA